MTFFLTILATIVVLFFIIRLFKKDSVVLKRNIKELEEKVRTLERSENQMQSVIKHLDVAIAAIHSDFRIAFHNQSFMKIFSPGYTISDKTFFTDVVRNTHLNQLVRDVFQSKSTQKEIVEISTPQGRKINEVQAVFISVENENLVALVFYDLTDLKEAEKMKRDFITNASHQLKTPLTAIQGYSEILIEDSDMGAPARKNFLSKIRSKSVEVADLVTKLLKLSKIEANVDEVRSSPIEITKTIQDLERKFEGNLKKHQIELVHQFGSDQILMHTDISLFQLILDNLLENAVKYSKPNGKVFISASQIGNEILLSVRDEGIGIPKQDQHRIFERFFRSSNAESHVHDGVGIGMALVKSSLDKLQAHIEIISDQNEGTEMILKFPKRLAAL